jgi:WD40 repeat protein
MRQPAVLSADGRVLAQVSDDWAVRAWETTTGRLLGEQGNGEERFCHIQLLHGSGRIIFLGRTQSGLRVCVWDLIAGRELAALDLDRPPSPHSFTRGGDGVVVSGVAGVWLWSLADGELRQVGDNRGPWIDRAAVSPAGRWLAGRAANVLRVWDLTTGDEQGPNHFSGRIESLRFSPDGALLCLGLGAIPHPTAMLWDVARRQAVARLPDTTDAPQLTADNRVVFGPYHGLLRLDLRSVGAWDARTGAALTQAYWPDGTDLHAELLPDGRLLRIGAADRAVRIWPASLLLGPPS